MSGVDSFYVSSPQGKGQALNIAVTCDQASSKLTVTIRGVGFRQPGDFLPGTVMYYSDAGNGEEPASVFLGTTQTIYAFGPQSSGRIIGRMLNSRTLDFKAKIYEAELTNFYSMPTANLRAAVAKFPYCRDLFGVAPAAATGPASAVTPKAAAPVVGVGMEGPADVRHPLLGTNRSFTESAWCRAQKCKLISKKSEPANETMGATVVYTYGTRVGTVQVQRVKDGSHVLWVRAEPGVEVWKTPELQALAAMVTGGTITASAVRTCATQRTEVEDLELRMPGGRANSGASRPPDFFVSCDVAPHSRPKLNMQVNLSM